MSVEPWSPTPASGGWWLGVAFALLVMLQWVEPMAGGGATFPSIQNKLGLAAGSADLKSFFTAVAASEAGTAGSFMICRSEE